MLIVAREVWRSRVCSINRRAYQSNNLFLIVHLEYVCTASHTLQIHSRLVLQLPFSIPELFRYANCSKAKAQTPIMVVIIATPIEAILAPLSPDIPPPLNLENGMLYTSPHTHPTNSSNSVRSCRSPISARGRKEIVISQVKHPTPEHRAPIHYAGENSNTPFFLVSSSRHNPQPSRLLPTPFLHTRLIFPPLKTSIICPSYSPTCFNTGERIFHRLACLP